MYNRTPCFDNIYEIKPKCVKKKIPYYNSSVDITATIMNGGFGTQVSSPCHRENKIKM